MLKYVHRFMDTKTELPAVDGGPLAVLENVAQHTSLHGVPNAYRARNIARKIIWSALFVAGFGKTHSSFSCVCVCV